MLFPSRRRHHLPAPRSSLFIGFGLLAGGLGARAQSVLTAPPPVVTTPPALQQFQTTQAGAENQPSEGGLNLAPLAARLLQWGPVNLRPHLLYSFSYADGILSAPGSPESTIINQFSPGILFVIGSHWTLDYSPSFQWYSNPHFQDSVGQNVALNGWTTYDDWTLGLSQTYRSFSEPVVQTGVQTDQESFGTVLSASHPLNSKVSLDLGLNQDFESAQNFQSYRQWSTMDWLNYQFWPPFDAGLGIGGGYVNVDAGANMTFEQFQGRIAWRATSRTRLVLNGGLEYRQFLSGGAPSLLNPVYGLSLQTALFTKTSLSLSASRAVSASYFVNQAAETTGFSVDLAQNIVPKLNLTLGATYGTVTYTATAVGLAGLGNYDYTSFHSRLTYAVVKRATLSVTYQFNDNHSTQPGLSFTSNQVGLELGYSF